MFVFVLPVVPKVEGDIPLAVVVGILLVIKEPPAIGSVVLRVPVVDCDSVLVVSVWVVLSTCVTNGVYVTLFVVLLFGVVLLVPLSKEK